MAIQLYRKGNTHVVKGFECEIKNVSLPEMYQLLDSDEGWVKDPAELYTESVQDDAPQPEPEPDVPEANQPENPAPKKRGRPAKAKVNGDED